MRLKMVVISFLLNYLFVSNGVLMANTKTEDKVIKTYMAFTLPVDPARIITLIDLDLSYALSSGLVDWSNGTNITSALAESWDFKPDNTIEFKLKNGLVWSDGSPIVANDFYKSFNRAKRVHGQDLKTFFDLVQEVTAPNQSKLVFRLKKDVANSGIIKKLTEPMYNLLAINDDGSLNLKKSSGPYTLSSVDEKQMTLTVNKNWIFYEPAMADRIEIRKPTLEQSTADIMIEDNWPNLMMASTLMPDKEAKKMKAHSLKFWDRNSDRIAFMVPSQNKEVGIVCHLLQYLSQKSIIDDVTSGLSGYYKLNQFFPQGFILYVQQFKANFSKSPSFLPEVFKKRPIVIHMIESKITRQIGENLKVTIKNLTGIEPKIIFFPLEKFNEARKGDNFDLFIGNIAIGDPNIDGTLGYIFGLEPPIIPNVDENGEFNFKKQFEAAAQIQNNSERVAAYKKIFSNVVDSGAALPLFHYSSTVITRANIDLSQVPITDEAISFAKVRFKK